MAFKLNLKDFDFKQFLLKRGEWIGLGVVLLIVIPVLASGLIKVFTAGSPSSKAEAFQTLTNDADRKIQTSVVPKDAEKPPEEFFATLRLEKVKSEPYYTEAPFFVATEIEDTKRRKPEI